jgi:hypothetical protein
MGRLYIWMASIERLCLAYLSAGTEGLQPLRHTLLVPLRAVHSVVHVNSR